PTIERPSRCLGKSLPATPIPLHRADEPLRDYGPPCPVRVKVQDLAHLVEAPTPGAVVSPLSQEPVPGVLSILVGLDVHERLKQHASGQVALRRRAGRLVADKVGGQHGRSFAVELFEVHETTVPRAQWSGDGPYSRPRSASTRRRITSASRLSSS